MKQPAHIPAALTLFVASLLPIQSHADSIPESRWKQWMPKVSGTIRAKGEYQTEAKEGRFEVRNARVSLENNDNAPIGYRAEIDLSDEGKIKMLDAYVGYQPIRGMKIRLGQMRVPFSIDAHRSPHRQYFANRSFIAKQVGNVRDVGLCLSYKFGKVPLSLEAGAFNGSGLTDQKDFWTNSFNFSAKAVYEPWRWLTLEGSVQRVSPNHHAIYLYDAGIGLHVAGWWVEGEMIRKHYAKHAFHDVNAWNVMGGYTLALHPRRQMGQETGLNALRFLLRCDGMTNHSDGKVNDSGVLQLTDAERNRLTGGLTLCGSRGRINAELRLNYEKYFYKKAALAKESERDKLVMEVMVHF